MLPRSQRSIFHLGEDGGDDEQYHAKDAAISMMVRRHPAGQNGAGRRRDTTDDAAVVGLQIVLVQKQQHHGEARPCHIVLKQMVWPPMPSPARHRRCRRPCGFLMACSLCTRELSPDKDVYMYRGDQGFCSEECRWKQMMADEAREHDAMVKNDRRRGVHHRRHLGPPRPAAAIHGAAPRRLLAVA